MRLVRVRLRNFRCYQTETSFDIQKLTVFVGCNDAGKSAVLDALAIFFDEAKLDSDDASINGDKTDVRIICEFADLPEEIVIDAGYPTNLKDEYLLNQDGFLEIHKLYNASLKTLKPSFYAQAIHPCKENINDLLLQTNQQLKERIRALGIGTEDIDLRVNTLIRRKLWRSTTDLDLNLIPIPLDKEAAGKIWDQLKKYLPSYALFKSDRSSTDQDAEAQDPMKAAVKEALKGQEEQLSAIANHVEQEVKAIAERTVDRVREMDPGLASQLNPRFSQPNWASIFKISLTGDDDIPLNKRGSGVRRLILLNFFRAKAEKAAEEKGLSNVIYAVEEPETSQHPHNQRMLMQAFYELSDNPECQVILTTHTPILARMVPADCLRYIGILEDGCRNIHCGTEDTYNIIAKDLGVLTDHNVKIFIGVEGINDINFLKAISSMLRNHGENVLDLEKLEDDGHIVFFPLGGTNLIRWTYRLAELNRPEFYLFDRDVAPPAVSQYQSTVDEINSRPRCKAVFTQKKAIENYLHPTAISAVRPDVQVSFGDFDDVPMIVARSIHEASQSPKSWLELSEEYRSDKERRAKRWLNSHAAEKMTPSLLDEIDKNGEVRGWLRTIEELM